MGIVTATAESLSSITQTINKVRYFSVELLCVAMTPNTKYDFYVDGILSNAFVRQFGKNLGDALVSNLDGTMVVQYHMSIQFNQQYVANVNDQSGYTKGTKLLEFRDPNGNPSYMYLPIRMKATS